MRAQRTLFWMDGKEPSQSLYLANSRRRKIRNMTLSRPTKSCLRIQVTSPTACGALAEPHATLVEPWWNPGGTLPQGRPGPPRSLSGLRPQSFQLLGKMKNNEQKKRKKTKHKKNKKHAPGPKLWRSTVGSQKLQCARLLGSMSNRQLRIS